MKKLSYLTYLRVTGILIVLASLVLAGWIFYLIIALPASYRAENWDVAWIGFDIAMLVCLATTAWAILKRRQLAIPGAMVSATFLVIDSWFDVITSQAGLDFKFALASALFVEIPSAIFLFGFGRRAIRNSLLNAHRHAGIEVVTVSLFKTRLMIFEDQAKPPQNSY